MNPGSDVEHIWEQLNWSLFREELYLAVCDALRHYSERRKGSIGSPLAQIATSTDPQRLTSGVDLETAEHALGRSGFRVSRGAGAKCFQRSLSLNPADWRFS